MTEIFPDLIDSCCYDCSILRYGPPPIYGEVIYDNDGNYIRTDSIKGTIEQKRQIMSWKNRRD
jgi:hypothetical protein